MFDDLLNRINVSTEETSLRFDICIVSGIKSNTVEVELYNREGVYSDVIVVGNYFPKKDDVGLLLLAGRSKYPFFIPKYFDNMLPIGSNSVASYDTEKESTEGNAVIVDNNRGSSDYTGDFVTNKIPNNIVNIAKKVADTYYLNYVYILALWAVETNWGDNSLFRKTNSAGNIEGKSGYKVIGYEIAIDNEKQTARYYRKYATIEDGFDALGNLLGTSSRYKGARQYNDERVSGNIEKYWRHLKNGGYAESKNFVTNEVSRTEKILKILGIK